MNITKLNREDLKIGDTCFIQVTVEGKEEKSWVKFRLAENCTSFVLADFENASFYSINPYTPLNLPTMTKIPETYPKYDPRRLFRKGDIVEMDTHGRDIAESMKKAGVELGKRYTVTKDESTTGHDNGYVSFAGDDCNVHHSMFFWLKLVTPVEEIEPYSVEEETLCWVVLNERIRGKAIVCEFIKKFHPNAQAAAETECRRLNAEYRKK